MSFEISREQYASLYGPTTGDAIRLADTELFAVVEEDLTTPGEEAVFGGGKVIRDGMGHDGNTVRDGAPGDLAVADTVITNVVVIDSIQTIWTDTADSAPGTVTQVRAAAQALIAQLK